MRLGWARACWSRPKIPASAPTFFVRCLSTMGSSYTRTATQMSRITIIWQWHRLHRLPPLKSLYHRSTVSWRRSRRTTIISTSIISFWWPRTIKWPTAAISMTTWTATRWVYTTKWRRVTPKKWISRHRRRWRTSNSRRCKKARLKSSPVNFAPENTSQNPTWRSTCVHMISSCALFAWR